MNSSERTPPNSFLDLLKQLQSLIPALMAFVTSGSTLPLFQFLNPSIVHDFWPVSSVVSLLVSATNFNLARSRNRRTFAFHLCLGGIIVMIVSLLVMIAIVDKLLFASDPAYREIF